ncbi:MAG: hypothetical protein QNJ84_15390 [Alphaproteobacteria bacterium]|nr:hypothetical protein [Alphaproteobacteria bacterium]
MASDPPERPVLRFKSPEYFDLQHRIEMRTYFEPIRRFFNGLNALKWNWTYTEPRQYAIDLNGDGQDEYILEARVRSFALYRCPDVCYTLLTIVGIERDSNGSITGPRYLGTIASPNRSGYERGYDEHILSIGDPAPSGWRSLANGPPAPHQLWNSETVVTVGGHRFCWTDKPEPIDFSQFHWIDERGGLADLLTIGLPYRDGGPGYFKIVGYDEECPE